MLVASSVLSMNVKQVPFQPVCHQEEGLKSVCWTWENFILCKWRECFKGALYVISSFNQATFNGVEQMLLRSELSKPHDRDAILGALG